MNYQKFENEEYDMLKCKKLIVIKDKLNNKYYETIDLDTIANIDWYDYKSKINSKVFGIYITSFIIFFITNMYLSFKQVIYNVSNGWIVIVIYILYTLINIILHETSHIVSLKIFDKKFDKVGLKMNYIFPAVYVRMNDAYMLTRMEKIIVHSSGIYINVLINSIALIVAYIFEFNILLLSCKLFNIGIIMNVLPILNSDGYKTMLAIFMYNEKKEKIYNSIFIKLISYGNILLAICYTIKFIFDIFSV